VVPWACATKHYRFVIFGKWTFSSAWTNALAYQGIYKTSDSGIKYARVYMPYKILLPLL
jgi:hypothetical protein